MDWLGGGTNYGWLVNFLCGVEPKYNIYSFMHKKRKENNNNKINQ